MARLRALSPSTLLGRLRRLRLSTGPRAAAERRILLSRLARARLPTARALVELHELALFARAYPDDARVLDAAEQLLAGFARRADLRRLRARLADSGIAGTEIRYPFFFPTASRLARRFGARLAIDWPRFDDPEELRPLLLAAAAPAESAWLRSTPLGTRAALAALAGRGGEAAALLGRLDALPGDSFTREALHDANAPFYRLAPGAGTPERTTARDPRAGRRVRRRPPPEGRPDLGREWRRTPGAVLEVRGREAEALVGLARDAMVCRQRDLDCFAYGDARDVRRFRWDDGLEFVAVGSLPERRLLLSAAYGLLTLRHGVPTGYAQVDGWLGTALLHFNTFDTFRGADAAWVFARALATARALFGAEAFAVEPYQLGQDNDEALDSGAWWFYAKLGFVPRPGPVAALARRERARLGRRPDARSSRATLARLAAEHLYWEPAGRAATVPPDVAAARAVSATLAARPEPPGEATAALADELARALGMSRTATSEERLWLERWGPLAPALPGWSSWDAVARRALGAALRAKAGGRESDATPLLRDHPRVGPALVELGRRSGARPTRSDRP